MVFEFTYVYEPLFPQADEISLTVISNVQVRSEEHPANYKVKTYQARIITFLLYNEYGNDVSDKYKFLTDDILRNFIEVHHENAIEQYANRGPDDE